MGQYHLVVNLTKKEFIDPHEFGCGLKFLEQVWPHGFGTSHVLAVLLCCSPNRGGGDMHSEDPMIGRWAGDAIAYVGDYSEDSDMLAKYNAEKIYGECRKGGKYKDISHDMYPVLKKEFGLTFKGKGWKNQNWSYEVLLETGAGAEVLRTEVTNPEYQANPATPRDTAEAIGQ